jgi:membrane fusion protein (multidrug efflux system)
LLIVLVAATLIYAALARVSDYAEGPAIVRVDGRLDLTSTVGGIVLGVDVQAGVQVSAGQPLIHLHTEAERQELEQIERELELKVVRLLLHPTDETSRQALSSLRASRERAEARLRERSVIAPRAGVVRNLRIRPGQLLNVGDPVLSLVDESAAAYSVVALVPGHFRPMLRRGMPMRFSLEGFAQLHDSLVIDGVGDEAVGPGEVRRYLGQELADTVPVNGSLVLVRARLPRATFGFDGRTYRYYDGIPGRVDIRVRSLPLLVMLFPPLRTLFGR